MEHRMRVGVAIIVGGLLAASVPWAFASSAQAQTDRPGTQRCGGSVITVGTPASASRGHARWLTHLACRTLTTRHGLVPTTRGGHGRRMTSMTATAYSSNWSGYDVATTQTPASVTGSWTEPSVSLPGGSSEAHSAVWVGLGGMSSQGELVQDGTGQDVSGSGSDHFFWYELYPMENAVAITNLGVAAGDQVSATSSWANGTATFDLCNVTRNLCVHATQSSPAPDNTAEWIVEAPQVNGSQATPPVFSPVSFTGASFQAPTSQTPAQSNAEAIDMVTSSGTAPYLAVPGPLNGDAFTVTYEGPPPGHRPSAPLSLHLGNGPSGGALTTIATWVRPSVAAPAVTSYLVRIQARSPRGVYGAYRYATVSATSTRLNIAGLRGYLYRVQVVARNPLGFGAWSGWSNPAYPR